MLRQLVFSTFMLAVIFLGISNVGICQESKTTVHHPLRPWLTGIKQVYFRELFGSYEPEFAKIIKERLTEIGIEAFPCPERSIQPTNYPVFVILIRNIVPDQNCRLMDVMVQGQLEQYVTRGRLTAQAITWQNFAYEDGTDWKLLAIQGIKKVIENFGNDWKQANASAPDALTPDALSHH